MKHHLLALAAVPHQAHDSFFDEVDIPRWRTRPEELLRRTKTEPGDTRLQRRWKTGYRDKLMSSILGARARVDPS